MARSRLPSNNKDYALASKMQLLVLTEVPYYGFRQCTVMTGAQMFNLSQVWVEKRARHLLEFFFFFWYGGKRCSSIRCFNATFPQTSSLNSLTLALGRSWQENGFFSSDGSPRLFSRRRSRRRRGEKSPFACQSFSACQFPWFSYGW